MAQTATNLPPVGMPAYPPDVMTLAEAAAYLRLSESEVLELVHKQGLPSRKIGPQWRFLRAAIQDWLRMPEAKDFWSRHFGALKDDPYLKRILQRIHSDRGQATAEDVCSTGTKTTVGEEAEC